MPWLHKVLKSNQIYGYMQETTLFFPVVLSVWFEEFVSLISIWCLLCILHVEFIMTALAGVLLVYVRIELPASIGSPINWVWLHKSCSWNSWENGCLFFHWKWKYFFDLFLSLRAGIKDGRSMYHLYSTNWSINLHIFTRIYWVFFCWKMKCFIDQNQELASPTVLARMVIRLHKQPYKRPLFACSR